MADRLCERAETAERDAREAERKSAERQRFLKGAGRLDLPGAAAPGPGGNTIALRQSIRTQIAQARAILPQIRQGAAAAGQDRGVVPGLSQYFSQMESSIGAALQGIEACLDAPERCSPPSFFCPSPPNIPPFTKNVQSADFIRQIQESYRKAANSAYQACRDLQAEASRDVGRLRQENQGARRDLELPGSGGAQRFGETDLYLRRAESLRREAPQHRLEADRASGLSGYCGARSRSFFGAEKTHALVEGLKAAGKGGGTPGTGLRLDAKVIDLKAEWDRKWNKGTTLGASDVPLPKLSVGGDGGQTVSGRAKEYAKSYVDRGGPEWWRDLKSSYRKADEQMGLTEFILSRPKELAKDVIIEFVEKNCPFGKTLTTGYKILTAVKTTADEVGGIVVDAPRVIAYGSEAEAKALAGRADRAPLNFLNNLFDDVTGRFPMPKFGQSGSAHE